MGIRPSQLCDLEALAADGVIHHYAVPLSAGDWKWATILVQADLGVAVEQLTFTADVAIADDGPWFATSIHDLRQAVLTGNKFDQFTQVTIAGDLQAALLGLSNPTPRVRINVANTGASEATLSMWIIFSD